MQLKGRDRRSAACAILVLGLLAPSAPGAAEPAPAQTGFSIERVAAGITLFRPADGGPGRTNSLVVERDDGLLVVDAQPTPAAARELLAAIAAQSSKPVRFLVLSHPHAEAAGGASAFPVATLVLASATAAEALADPTHDFGAEERARAAEPALWVEPPRHAPTLHLRGTVDLADPAQPAELRVHLIAHSRGDLSVYLPKAQVLYLGGLLPDERNPFAGDDADVGHWLGVLNAIIVAAPRTIVGLHGPASDLTKLIAIRDSFAWLRGQVEEGFVDRLPPAKIEARVLGLAELGDWFGVGAEPSFLPGLVSRVVEEGVAHRRKRGLWPPVSRSAEEAGAEDGPPAP